MKAPYDWAGIHRRSLQENQPATLKELAAEGTLDEHIRAIGRDAQRMFETIVRGLEKANPTWTQDQRERCAAESVMADLVLVKDQETLNADRDGYLD